MHPAVQFDRLGWGDDGPGEGALDREEATSLVEVLRHHTSTPGKCWLAIWYGYGELSGGVSPLVAWRRFDPGFRRWFMRAIGARLVQRSRRRMRLERPPALADAPTLELPGRWYYLYRGAIEVVPRFEFRPASLQTPNLWWPEDRAWFVGSEIDFDSTLVACDRACADAILASDLEALEIAPDARLDIEGDTVNPR